MTDHGYTLQSKQIAVIVLPEEGGRIASLKSIPTGLEFLTQTERQGSWPMVGLDTPFRSGACAGIEECLPTVGPCGPGAIAQAANLGAAIARSHAAVWFQLAKMRVTTDSNDSA